MDVTKELAAKANFGDENAIAELRLTNMATIEFSSLNEVTKDRDLSAYSPSVLKLPLQEKCWA